ncbi:hypothetical protein C463_11012 [Halorubrum californiense DSM 19288]|uniref:DUF4382 domain-containing protein n=1 Tax=Halorubrum californiense DSM 19288 TaxID=1227465 RepID=M0E2V0_9EURY|nr:MULTISPECIES: DUF4382 domain-containing protein [Halorubrum]ELZ42101.1 hypothetical protein C463_11012 [Halorubrum californiense DSM 19288]TKX65401.1 DUF4382 domain-containing protein [Halorubrum sp. GN11GM_10-3_MGM]
MTDHAPDLDALDRRTYLKATGVAALGTTGLAGCVGRATGTLATQVTDQPADIADFESLVVTVEGFWLGPEGADPEESDDDGNETDTDDGGDDGSAGGNETDAGDETGDEDDAAEGREYFEFDESQEADLVELQNGETQLVDERELQTGEYPYLQLDVSSADGTLTDGSDAPVDLPGNAPLKFNEPFETRENTRTTFTADFAPVLRGNGRYLLRPVPSGIEVEYEEPERSDESGSSDGNETDGS